MSRIKLCHHIPFDIQAEIMKRLPVESLVRFRSVSKTWKSLIGSNEFIHDHYIHQKQTQPQHIFLNYEVNKDPECVSLIDDDTFPNNKIYHMIPKAINQFNLLLGYDFSHGVLCNFSHHNRDLGSYMAVLWNPTVKKSVGIVIPRSGSYTSLGLGFGVCPNTSDPKIVKISIPKKPCIQWEIGIFTLSSRAWKSVSINPPSKLLHFSYHVPIEGFIYWIGMGEFGTTDNFIIYFDLTSEEFGEVCLPDNLVHSRDLTISKRHETLVVLEYFYESEIPVCDVWIMNDCVTKSLTKMFTIKSPCDRIVLGFRMNGEAITEIMDHDETYMREVYESCSGDFNAIGIQGDYLSFNLSSYTGSLLLLDESDSIIH